MTLVASLVETTRAKAAATEAKAAIYVEQIRDAHKRVVAAEKSGHQRSLELAIAAGEVLLKAKDEIKGKFKWSEWRAEYLDDIPQTTASLYMRLATNKDRLLKPDLATEDGKRISNAVATFSAKGELSIRKAAGLLVTRTRTAPTPPSKPTEEDIGKKWLKDLAADELVLHLKQIHQGMEYLRELSAALVKVLFVDKPASVGATASELVRRM